MNRVNSRERVDHQRGRFRASTATTVAPCQRSIFGAANAETT